MIRFYMPQLGDSIRLTKDWTFKLYSERRNKSLFELIKGSKFVDSRMYEHGMYTHETPWISRNITLNIGTLLKVDRIYIRQGQPEFDSVTFSILEIPDSMKDEINPVKKTKKLLARFWVKIFDVNNIYFEPATEPTDIEFDLKE